jgi:hypothetical protein
MIIYSSKRRDYIILVWSHAIPPHHFQWLGPERTILVVSRVYCPYILYMTSQGTVECVVMTTTSQGTVAC